MSQSARCFFPKLCLCLAVGLVAPLLAVGPALAASKQSQEKAARKACLNGDYGEGVAILSNLFVETEDPTYIYNQGRCFEQNRRYEDAIARFQEFLRAARQKLRANEKVETEQHIADCKQMLEEQRRTSPIQPAPEQVAAPAPAPASGPPPAPTPGPSPLVSQSAQSAPASSGAGLRSAGIFVASFGVAAVGAGVLFNLKANSIVDDMYSTSDGYSKESSRKTYATLTWVGYGVGAACVVTGAILYAFGFKSKAAPATGVALVPTVGAEQAGAALMGVF